MHFSHIDNPQRFQILPLSFIKQENIKFHSTPSLFLNSTQVVRESQEAEHTFGHNKLLFLLKMKLVPLNAEELWCVD